MLVVIIFGSHFLFVSSIYQQLCIHWTRITRMPSSYLLLQSVFHLYFNCTYSMFLDSLSKTEVTRRLGSYKVKYGLFSRLRNTLLDRHQLTFLSSFSVNNLSLYSSPGRLYGIFICMSLPAMSSFLIFSKWLLSLFFSWWIFFHLSRLNSISLLLQSFLLIFQVE